MLAGPSVQVLYDHPGLDHRVHVHGVEAPDPVHPHGAEDNAPLQGHHAAAEVGTGAPRVHGHPVCRGQGEYAGDLFGLGGQHDDVGQHLGQSARRVAGVTHEVGGV